VPNRGGRPRCPPGAKASVYLRATEVDMLAKIALRNDVSLSWLIRRMVRHSLRQGAIEKIEPEKQRSHR
jgi:Ribbon-helix-helix protein, copG family